MWRKLLILFIISMSLTAHAEFISKPYEIENVVITFYFFDTELEMQEYYLEHFGEQEGETEIDTLMRGFSDSAGDVEKNICLVDLYVVRPQEVDDAKTKTIGHEVLHCVYGPGYHVKWEFSRGSIQLSQ